MNEAEIKERMTTALMIAKECWKKAEMPLIYDSRAEETGKVSLAILAVKIFDELNKK